jgi:hypothetical protein
MPTKVVQAEYRTKEFILFYVEAPPTFAEGNDGASRIQNKRIYSLFMLRRRLPSLQLFMLATLAG